MTTKMYKAMNDQMNNEFHASAYYYNLAAKANMWGMNGFAKWLVFQAEEELEHFNAFYNYIVEVNYSPVINNKMLNTQVKSKKVTEIPHESLKFEVSVTKEIHSLYKLATTEDDFATMEFLQKFIKEQVEEEALFHDLIDMFNLAKDSELYRLDSNLGKRKK